MKLFKKTIAVLAALMLALAYAPAVLAEDGMFTMEGYVLEVLEGGFILDDKSLGEVLLNTDDATAWDGVLAAEPIEAGQYVFVEYDGKLTRSVPPQAHADKVGCYVLSGIVEGFTQDGFMLTGDELFGDVIVKFDPAFAHVYTGSAVTVYYNGVMALSLPGQVSAAAVIVPELEGVISGIVVGDGAEGDGAEEDGKTEDDAEGGIADEDSEAEDAEAEDEAESGIADEDGEAEDVDAEDEAESGIADEDSEAVDGNAEDEAESGIDDDIINDSTASGFTVDTADGRQIFVEVDPRTLIVMYTDADSDESVTDDLAISGADGDIEVDTGAGAGAEEGNDTAADEETAAADADDAAGASVTGEYGDWTIDMGIKAPVGYRLITFDELAEGDNVIVYFIGEQPSEDNGTVLALEVSVSR